MIQEHFSDDEMREHLSRNPYYGDEADKDLLRKLLITDSYKTSHYLMNHIVDPNGQPIEAANMSNELIYKTKQYIIERYRVYLDVGRIDNMATIQATIDHITTLCGDRFNWSRGVWEPLDDMN